MKLIAQIRSSFVLLLTVVALFFAPLFVFAQTTPSQPSLGAALTAAGSTFVVQSVIPTVFALLAAVVSVLGAFGVKWIQTNVKNTAIAGILARLTAAVQTVVLDVNGTVKAKYLAAAADGEITDAEKADLKATALAKVKEHLGAKGLAEIVSVLGIDSSLLDSFLGSHIEAAVEGMKTAPVDARVATSAPVAPAPVPAAPVAGNP